MADDHAPVSEIILKRKQRVEFWWERWEWHVFVDPPSRRKKVGGMGLHYSDYHGTATTQKRALKKAMKLVPRYVRTQIR